MIDFSKQSISQWTRLGSRKTFGAIMNELAEDYRNIHILAADLSSSANLNEFIANYPEMFSNVGIAEQNMTGIAAGLAKEGYNVFITSFAPFASMRAFEAVRTLVGYMHLNVKIVALASGVSMESHGNTHYGLEDIALMRTIPGMLVLTPADCTEVVKSIQALIEYDGPAYLRLTGIPGGGMVYKEDYEFKIGKGIVLREGTDIVIIASGFMVSESLRAARGLEKDGISAKVVDMHTIKPIDVSLIRELAEKYKMIVTVEEHNIIGGLGSAVAEELSEVDKSARLLRLGIRDWYPTAGDYQYVLNECGISASKIREAVVSSYNNMLL